MADVALETAVAESDDPVGAALASGARLKASLLQDAGNGLSSKAVAENLGITRQAVDTRRKGRKLLAVSTPSGDWVYPMAQFRPDGRPLDGSPDLLAAVPGAERGEDTRGASERGEGRPAAEDGEGLSGRSL